MDFKRKFYVVGLLLFFTLSCKGERVLELDEQTPTPEEENTIDESVVIPEGSPFGVNGRLKVVGTQLSNQFDVPVQLRGMSTHGLQYRGNCYTQSSLHVLFHRWKVDIMRIAMYVQEGGYESDPVRFTHFVDSLVDICYRNGVYAIIDWHMLDPGDPNANTELAKVFFEHVSKKHANKGNVIYEIANEPNDKQHPVTWPMIKNYADQIIPIIRANDPESVIIVGTPEFASRPDHVIGNPVTMSENVLYTMHFYAADDWSTRHQEKRMGYVAEAMDNGIPVFVTEFGTQDGWGNGANDFAKSSRWLRFLAERKISWCNWNYSDSPLSGASWVTGTCANDGPWEDFALKEAGLWIKRWFTNPMSDWSGSFPFFGYDIAGTGTIAPTSTKYVSESKSTAVGFLPTPSSGVARVQVAPNAVNGVEFGNSIVTLGTSGVNTANKFSLYDLGAYSTLAKISFKANFNDTHRGLFSVGIGSANIADASTNIFKGDVGYMNATVAPGRAGLFAAFRLPIGGGATGILAYRNPNPTGASATHASGPALPRNGQTEFELYCNNTSIAKTYQRNGVSRTVPGRSLHMFVNGDLIEINGTANLATCAEIPEYEPLNAIVFSSEQDPWTPTGVHGMKASISDIEIRSFYRD